MILLFLTCRSGQAAHERIARHACGTPANGTVVAHLANCLLATHTGTWINTLVVDAGPVGGTVRTRGALGSAVGRGSFELGPARADGLLVYFATV